MTLVRSVSLGGGYVCELWCVKAAAARRRYYEVVLALNGIGVDVRHTTASLTDAKVALLEVASKWAA